MSTKPSCPKCQHEMERGFMPEYVYGNAARPSIWVRGWPQKSFLFGTKVPANYLNVVTYRCKHCGFLESYALEQSRDK